MADFVVYKYTFREIKECNTNVVPNVQNSPLDYLKNPVQNSFFMFRVTSDEIATEISKLKNGKAAGPFRGRLRGEFSARVLMQL